MPPCVLYGVNYINPASLDVFTGPVLLEKHLSLIYERICKLMFPEEAEWELERSVPPWNPPGQPESNGTTKKVKSAGTFVNHLEDRRSAYEDFCSGNTSRDGAPGQSISNYFDLGRVPYVSYGVKYIDLVSLDGTCPVKLKLLLPRHRGKRSAVSRRPGGR